MSMFKSSSSSSSFFTSFANCFIFFSTNSSSLATVDCASFVSSSSSISKAFYSVAPKILLHEKYVGAVNVNCFNNELIELALVKNTHLSSSLTSKKLNNGFILSVHTCKQCFTCVHDYKLNATLEPISTWQGPVQYSAVLEATVKSAKVSWWPFKQSSFAMLKSLLCVSSNRMFYLSKWLEKSLQLNSRSLWCMLPKMCSHGSLVQCINLLM